MIGEMIFSITPRNFLNLCSLAGCCRLNRVNFAEYLNDVLPRLAVNRNSTELRELLPDRWKN